LTFWNLAFILDSTLGIYVGSPTTFVGSKGTLEAREPWKRDKVWSL